MAVTVSKFNGDIVAIWADGTKIGHSVDSTLSVTQDLPDATTKDSAWMEHIRGNRSWEVSGSGLVAFDSSMSAIEIIDYILNANTVAIVFKTTNADDTQWSGNVSVSSTSFQVAQNNPGQFDFTMTGNGVITAAAGSFTPLDLGTKLLNWWDGQIVDETANAINNWLDQKGSIDFAATANKGTYIPASDILAFTAASSEYMESNANAASFNRSDGEYWFVIDNESKDGQVIALTDTSVNTRMIVFQIRSGNTFRINTNINGTTQLIESTTTMPTGKNIIRIKSNGSAYTVYLNNVDISAEFVAGDGTWEDALTWTNISLNNLKRIADGVQDLRIHAMLRCDATLTSQEATNMYNYLNAKY